MHSQVTEAKHQYLFFLDRNIRFKSVSAAYPADFGAFANTNNLFILRGYNDFL